MSDRLAYLLEQRGFDVRTVRAVMHGGIENISPLEARRKLEALGHMSGSEALLGVAALLKRVKNITKDFDGTFTPELRGRLKEPAEAALVTAFDASEPSVMEAARKVDYREAMRHIATLSGPVDKFFVDVLVMADDKDVRNARLSLLSALRRLVLDNIADISELAS